MKGKNSIGKALVSAFCGVLTLGMLAVAPFLMSDAGDAGQMRMDSPQVLNQFDKYMTNRISDALDGVLAIQKVYWLSDDDQVAPVPNSACFAQTDDPEVLRQLMADAAGLLEGQNCYFSPDIQIKPGSQVHYYLDETIFAVAWKEIHGECIYTFTEVKVAHPSQLRRFLSGGEYSSGKRFLTTEMSASVNAVVASSGDFYGYRDVGIIVCNGKVYRSDGGHLETCMIDENGDMHFVYAKTLGDKEAVERYVKKNAIRFSISFGPVLVDDGKARTLTDYPIGEINECYSRAALCQMDTQHYLLCAANYETGFHIPPKLRDFQKIIAATGCKMAYTLDGGQTAAIAMNHELVNTVSYGSQRQISDILYFATAVPSGG